MKVNLVETLHKIVSVFENSIMVKVLTADDLLEVTEEKLPLIKYIAGKDEVKILFSCSQDENIWDVSVRDTDNTLYVGHVSEKEAASCVLYGIALDVRAHGETEVWVPEDHLFKTLWRLEVPFALHVKNTEVHFTWVDISVAMRDLVDLYDIS